MLFLWPKNSSELQGNPGLTSEVALDPQVAHAEAKDGQLVQARANIVIEGQQVRQPVQLHVQPIPVALRGVGFDNSISFGSSLLPAEQKQRGKGEGWKRQFTA